MLNTKNSNSGNTDGTEKEVTLQLTCMTMLDPVTGWFEITEVPTYIVQELSWKTSNPIQLYKINNHLYF